jgi:hypothetical protein
MALIFEMLTSKLSVVRMGGREIHLLDASVAASLPHTVRVISALVATWSASTHIDHYYEFQPRGKQPATAMPMQILGIGLCDRQTGLGE